MILLSASSPASFLRGILWLPVLLISLLAAGFLALFLRYAGKRIQLFLRMKKLDLPVRGLHPLWLFLSLPGRADFVIRGRSKETYAVRFAESWFPGTEYAICSADRWYKAVVLHLPPEDPVRFHLGFSHKRFSMDFRADAAEKAPGAVPVWLLCPRVRSIVSRTYDADREKNGAVRYQLVPGESVDGIQIADGATFLHLLTDGFRT